MRLRPPKCPLDYLHFQRVRWCSKCVGDIIILLFLLIDGTLVGFGRNDYGQLGLGYTQPRVNGYHVVSALNDKNISSVSAGCYHSIAVASNGMLYVFGRNNLMDPGTGDLGERYHPFPVDSFLGKRIIQVAAGFYHTLVLLLMRVIRGLPAGDKEHRCASDTFLRHKPVSP